MSDHDLYKSLQAEKIEESIEHLSRRISERFPLSSLSKVCVQLLDIAEHAKEKAAWVAEPIKSLRIATWALIITIVLGITLTMVYLPMPNKDLPIYEFIQILEAGINDIVLIGAAIFFLISLESRIKRKRALAAIHELRSIAHIIDMHQLTKDPQRLLKSSIMTLSSPTEELTAFELSRYLDYCSEMLALTGKIAALYVQKFDDATALAAVNEVESLTTGLSRKIWQKLIILNSIQHRELKDRTIDLRL